MLTRLREIVEKVASAPRLNEALNILVTDICLAMDTEVCSVYLADHDRRCYYLMATRGLKKPRGRTVTLAFDEGIVGLVGRLAEPINLADAQKHPSFKYIPSVKEERFRAFLGVPIIQRRQLLGVLVVQQRELRQYDESEESFLVTLAGFAPIFPDICYHLTHYKPAAADIPVASDNPAHYADAIRYNARTPLQGSLLPLTRLVWA